MNVKTVSIAFVIALIMPSIAFAPDPYFINAIGKNITLGNVDHVFVDNTNSRVGIGKTNPTYTLDVDGSARFSSPTYIGSTEVGGFTNDGGAANTFNVIGVSGKSISLGANGAFDHLFVSTAGNVGIGTISPQAGLQINKTNPALRTNGSVLIDGRVGLGTTNPLLDLVIAKTGTAAVFGISVNGTGNTEQSVINLLTLDSGGNGSLDTGDKGWHLSGRGDAFGTAAERNDLIFFKYDSGYFPLMTIDFPTGNVGIGTGSPTAGLQINTTNPALRTNGSAMIDGNVGIGIAPSSVKLHVNGSVNVTSGNIFLNGTLSFTGGTGTVGGIVPNLSGGGSANYTARWSGVSSLESGSIYDNGNVGIGTTNPNARLNVLSNANDYAVRISNTAGSGIQSGVFILAGSSTSDYALSVNNAANTLNYFHVRGDGNIGIKTTAPAGTLHINSSAAEGVLRVENTTGASLIFVNGTSGFVGIGLTNASQRLEVNGNVSAAGFFYTSDEGLKKNIQTLNGLEIVEKLRGVSFEWKNGGQSVGLVAQEVEKVLPEVVVTNQYTGMKSVNYGALVGPLVESVKEQQAEIQKLQRDVDAIRGELTFMRSGAK